jgi:hypothetical protein
MTLRSVRLRHDSMGCAGSCGGESAITLLTPCITRRTGSEREERKESVGKKAETESVGDI